MSEIKTDALERVLSWVDNADLADADDIYGYCRKCHAEIAHKDGCDLPVARAELTALRARVAQGEANSKRLDWLEREAGGYPVEVDTFMSCDPPAAFLTIHVADHTKEPVNGIVEVTSVRLGQGHSLREAIDNASSESSHA